MWRPCVRRFQWSWESSTFPLLPFVLCCVLQWRSYVNSSEKKSLENVLCFSQETFSFKRTFGGCWEMKSSATSPLVSNAPSWLCSLWMPPSCSTPTAASYELLMKQGWEPELLSKAASSFSSPGPPWARVEMKYRQKNAADSSDHPLPESLVHV